MRKFFMMVAVVALALLVATPSMALDFKFGAEYRVRFYTMINQGFSDAPGTNPSGMQLRIRPRFDVSDDNGNMTATLRLEIGDIEFGQGGGASGVTNGGPNGNVPGPTSRVGNGSGGRIGDDGVNVETKWGYMDFASPFGVPLRWRAGLQPWYLTKGMVVDDDVAGLRAYGKYSMLSYEAAIYTASSASTLVDDNTNFYQFKVDAAIMKPLNVGGYYIYGRNAGTANADVVTQQFIGFGANGDFGFLRYDLDFLWGQQNGGNSGNFADAAGRQRVQGWGLDGGVHIPVGPVLIHVVGSYATGDDNNGGKSEVLPWISPSWNGAGGLYQLIGSGGDFDATETTQDYPGGLWMIGAGAEYRPVKALWLRAMYGYAGFTGSGPCSVAQQTSGQCYAPGTALYAPLVGEDGLGHEISLRADYTVWTNFRIMGGAAWLIPPSGETVSEYVLQFLYNF